jgi:flagellar assembly protein FliH
MDNVIEKRELEKHTIEKYRFKVLGSAVQDENAPNNSDLDEDAKEIAEPIESFVPQVDESGFVEELLKKSDELSSNIIKLQIQIEKQESDFKARLEEEVSRQRKEASKEGYEQAKSELEEKSNEIILNYTNSAKKLDEKIKEMDNFLDKTQDDIAHTAIDVAKEVVKKEISASSSSVATALSKELMSELKEANQITLKVNPQDLEVLREIYKDNDKVSVDADLAISKGGVVLFSKKGNLDGNISQRFEKVKNLLENN